MTLQEIGNRTVETGYEDRLIGEWGTPGSGATLVVIGALHGNELAGVKAAKHVLAELKQRQISLHGHVVALVGNRAAMRRGTRFVQSDLNRLWSSDRVLALTHAAPATLTSPEEIELQTLAATLDQFSRSASGQVALLDLHTSSADSPPFVAVGDDPIVDRVVASTGVIEVKGTARYLKGMLVEHASRSGWAAMAFEAGRHEDEVSVLCHEAMIWQVMFELGMVDESAIPEAPLACEAMRKRTQSIGQIVEIVYRHAVTTEDAFRMNPGYLNFQQVEEGEPLGVDRNGIVVAPVSGRIFLPLYQEQGDEGFFIVKDIG